ncbi:CHAT domain-containing protein [Altererythrobacter ishigakiensis]|uniref:CHAT domain-containing protein n=2 Tax=Altererythrobacter ishigakiensis TaxID=476157 RepID=A0A562UW08_9SPHN|nr:CHAT domain-containing protein [Altererythrobacter ishigakiensis]
MRLRMLVFGVAAWIGSLGLFQASAQNELELPSVGPLIVCAGPADLALPSEECMREEAYWSAQWAVQSSAAQALDAVNARFARGSGELAVLARRLEETQRALADAENRYFAALALPDGSVRERQLAETTPIVEQLKGELSAIELALKGQFPEYANLVAPEPLTALETQALLEPGEGLIMAIPGETGTFIFLVTHSTLDWYRSELSRADLGTFVDDLRLSMGVDGISISSPGFKGLGAALDRATSLSATGGSTDVAGFRGRAFDRAKAFQLYSELFGDLTTKLEELDHVYAVVSGPLSAFPLGALVTRAPEGYDYDPNAMRKTAWLQRSLAITVVPAPTSLRALAGRRETQAEKTFLGIGNACTGWGIPNAPEPPPEICGRIGDLDDIRIGKQSALSDQAQEIGFSQTKREGRITVLSPDELRYTMTYLPGTRSELLQISELLGADPQRDLIMAQKASESWVRSDHSPLSDYRIIVFATHGLVATDGIENLDEPGLILTPPDTASAMDDGFLSASEIAADLELDADFLILSACNTASPSKSGADSLSGLARAFFYAGARSLLVSHWPVLDDIAPKITTATIANFSSMPHKGRANAFREALLPIMNNPETADPYYWAPFVLVGQN